MQYGVICEAINPNFSSIFDGVLQNFKTNEKFLLFLNKN